MEVTSWPALAVGSAALWHAVLCGGKALSDNRAWRAKVVSTLHATTVVLFALRELLLPAPAGHSEWLPLIFCLSSGYYLWAFSLTLIECGTNPRILAALHHFCCFVVYAASLQENLLPILWRWGLVFFLAELSTICANLRWFAFKSSGPPIEASSPRQRRLISTARLCEIMFVLTFFITRIAVGIPASFHWWMNAAPTIHTADVLFPKAEQAFYMTANLIWNCSNLFWFVKLVMSACRPRKTPPSAARNARQAGAQPQARVALNNKSKGAGKANRGDVLSLRLDVPPVCDEALACEITISEALECKAELWFVSESGCLPQHNKPRSGSDVFSPPSEPNDPLDDGPVQRECITRIHGKWYDLRGFDHPGGPVARSLADGRDGTALFVAHHPFTPAPKLAAVLKKYEVSDEDAQRRRLTEAIVRDDDDGEDYTWEFADAFEVELKSEVKAYFKKEADRRGVSFVQATKATPKRWLEIFILGAIFWGSVPALVRGELWALFFTPTACWIWMVNYWHDACHFALSRRWWVNATLPYVGIWFSSPTAWYHQHVIGHHAYPNIDHKDPDLAHAPQLMREHKSIRWRSAHEGQHRWHRFLSVWAIAVGLGLNIAADLKMVLQHEYNRVVAAAPNLRHKRNIIAHFCGRALYLFTTMGKHPPLSLADAPLLFLEDSCAPVGCAVWPWLVFESWGQCLVFSTVPMVIFSLLFMGNSQINHLTVRILPPPPSLTTRTCC